MHQRTTRRTNSRRRVSQRRRKPYAWLGAGAITLGVGAALASGSGIAHADGAAPNNSSPPSNASSSASSVGDNSASSSRSGKIAPAGSTGRRVNSTAAAAAGTSTTNATVRPRTRPAASTGSGSGSTGNQASTDTTEQGVRLDAASAVTTTRPTGSTGSTGSSASIDSTLTRSPSAPSAATTRISAAARAVPVTPAIAAAPPAVAANPVVGLLAGALSVFGLNAPVPPANPLGAVLWGFFRTIETGFGLTPLAGTPTVSTLDPSTGVVIGTLGFTEPAGQPLTYSVTTNPARGSVTVDSTGAFTYTPTQATTAAIDMFAVTASDGIAATSETVTVPLGSTDTIISAQYGSTTIEGKYVVQNNAYNNGGGQTINVTSTGFSIIVESGSASTSGAPLAYPSVYVGCHYGNCSPSSPLPVQLSQIHSVTSSITDTYVATGTYDASYDIWLDPAPKTTGVNQQEIMIWLKEQGPIQPVGSKVAAATIDGQSWDVWQGSNGQNNVVSYVASTPITTLTEFSVLSFIDDTEIRTAQTNDPVTNGWYLTSIQAGFEPWNGGVGLAVDFFSATVS